MLIPNRRDNPAFAYACGFAAAIVVIGLLGAVLGAVWNRGTNASIALAYYVIGSLIIIVGLFSTGGLSPWRDRMTRRNPTGAGGYALQSLLAGAVLIGIGALVDIYHPF